MWQTYNSYLYWLKELINDILCSCILWRWNSRSCQRWIWRRIDARTTGCRCLPLWLPSLRSSGGSKKPPGKNYCNRKASNCPNRTWILIPFKKFWVKPTPTSPIRHSIHIYKPKWRHNRIGYHKKVDANKPSKSTKIHWDYRFLHILFKKTKKTQYNLPNDRVDISFTYLMSFSSR